MNTGTQKRIEFLDTPLGEAEAIALRFFRAPLNVVNKDGVGGYDPVTQADKDIEALLRDAIAQTFPDDAVLGEEYANQGGTSGYEWIIDPIDGTRAFVIGAPSFTILIALHYQGVPVYGVISQPFMRERFEGAIDRATYQRCEDQRALSTSGVLDLERALLVSTFPEIGTPEQREAFLRVDAKVKLTRYGLDAYGYALLAMGQVDLAIEAGLKPFDYAAPLAVVRSAGGVFCNWQGGDKINERGEVIAAATRELADAAVKALAT